MQDDRSFGASGETFRLIVETLPGLVAVMTPSGEVDHVNARVLDYFGRTLEELRRWGTTDAVHPDDLPQVVAAWQHSVETGEPYEIEHRIRRADGEYRWFQARGVPLRDADGRIVNWYLLLTDIDERKHAEEALRSEEQTLRLIVDNIPGYIGIGNAAGEVEFLNQPRLEYFGKTLEEMKNWAAADVIHPEDLPRLIDASKRAIETGQPLDVEHRARRADGVYRWVHARGRPQRDASGRVIRWYYLATDIDERKRAEERLLASETEYRRIIDAIPHLISALSPDGQVLYSNRAILEYIGLSREEFEALSNPARLFHPEDFARVSEERRRGFEQGRPFELELRAPHHADGYRWCLIQYKPVHDEHGRTVRWYATATDIHERKRNEDQLTNENLVLREEISRASMFEEIVGTAPALQAVLSRVTKVAPSDTTVLISGETGTGKELVARAIHKRSRRASRAFVTVNCAAIPRDLLASELFGHEKGAFTGAAQRRLGRFEVAEGGTIFLDEIGELPGDMQIALLRVLQEHEFERLGGSGSIQANVRVIAATNRVLEAAVAAGTFRSDLYYRLNVFPIDMPPLRERQEDIPLLVEYFIDRYARKAGKSFRSIDKKSLDLLRSYRWPGNIRELQNVIERSILVCDDEAFSVDESWLSSRRPRVSESKRLDLSVKVAAQERETIEAALSESEGRVFGPSGAATKLGVARSTLESKIRSLKIDKTRFKPKSR